ncbi:MAG TPA: hypothetical protein ENI11_00005 [Actinobacteria bacterium]|nr:hypothetical protein [Actinomycetota bacterium]
MKYYLYKIENKTSSKVYIGQCFAHRLARRKSRHFSDLHTGHHENAHLQSAYNKYGPEVWKWEVIDECVGADAANEKETYYIVDVYESWKPERGYNIRRGSKHTPLKDKTKRKISESLRKRYKDDPSYREKISEANRRRNGNLSGKNGA